MEFAIFDILIRVIVAIIGIIGARYLLRYFDKLSGFEFKKAFEIMKGDPRALSNYYAGRFIGVCILIAIIIA